MAQVQLLPRWGALRPWPRPAAGVALAQLQGDRPGGKGDRTSPGGRVHMPGPGDRAMPAGASCGVQGPGWCAGCGLWACVHNTTTRQHNNTTKARPVVARAPNGHGRGLVLGFTCTGQGPEGPPCRWRARCWLRAKGPPQASLVGALGSQHTAPRCLNGALNGPLNGP